MWITTAAYMVLALGQASFSQEASIELQAGGARPPGPEERRPLVLEGFVLAPDGNPAEGAVVVSSAGGKAVTDVAGNYRLTVELPLETTSVHVTARFGSRSVSTSVALNPAMRGLRLEPLLLAGGSACSPSWLSTFGAQGTDNLIFALATHDDGNGPAVYAGGQFTSAGGVPAPHVAKWDGTSWSALGSGTNFRVQAFATYDDGGGAELYAGGSFTIAGTVSANRIARWDGTAWSALGSGITGGPVNALAVYDDGSGPALYAGGEFSAAGGVPASFIAKWNGTSWSALSSALSGSVYALAVYDDGGGPELYAGGLFSSAGGVTARRVAKWDGSSWSALGSGVQAGLIDSVQSLAVYDDGGGADLYAGGDFTIAGGVTANHIARWNGSSWSALGSGLNNGVNNDVLSLTAWDGGGAPALYAGGKFTNAGLSGAFHVGRWDGTSWSALGSGANGNVNALAVFDDGAGAALHAGGTFTAAGGKPANFGAKWEGSGWSVLGRGLTGAVYALATHDDGSGTALYAGGYFMEADGVPTSRIAKWEGSGWSPLGGGIGENVVLAFTTFDDGSGPALYVGGRFTTAGGLAASHIAKWDGSIWSALGSGVEGAATLVGVRALAVFDDGSGRALYAGGEFTSAGGLPANFVAKWSGSTWSPLGVGTNDTVYALAVHDDGSGPALYAGGVFTIAGGVAANRIARWDGSSWSPLADGLGGSGGSVVRALTVHDDGGGAALYAGGLFRQLGPVFKHEVARWDGTSWLRLADFFFSVYDLTVHDDGNGEALYAAGFAGGAAGDTRTIARWDGSSWSPLGGGTSGPIWALTVHDDGGGPMLVAGGEFQSALDSGDRYLARWGVLDETAPELECPSPVNAIDRVADGPGEVVTFAVTAQDDCDLAPAVVCVPPSGSTFPRGTTFVTCTATDAAGNQSTCQFPVTVALKVRQRGF